MESGDDKLKGEFGNDFLVGGLGNDDLYDGSGNDVFDVNKLGVFESGKNIKVHTDENKSDLLAIIYGYNSKDLNGLIKSIIIVWFLEFKIKAFALLNRFCDENNKDVFN